MDMFFVVTSMATGEEAEVIPFRLGQKISWHIITENPALKTHLQQILATEAYSLRPGSTQRAVAPLHILPNTVEFLQCFPEILAWRGYKTHLVKKTHKSSNLLGAEPDNLIIPTHYDIRGNLIASRVPHGYLAVHRSGRVIAGGRWWLVDVNAEGDKWYLLPNPYEEETEENLAKIRSYMAMGIEGYHPGVNPKLYAEGDVTDELALSNEGIFEERFRLDNLLKFPQPKQVTAPNLPSELEPGYVVYSPEIGVCFRSQLWGQVNLPLQDYTWYLFPEPDLTDEEKLIYEKIYGPSPMFVRGLDRGLVYERADMDISQGIPLRMPSLYAPPAFQQRLPLEVNRTSRSKLSLEDYTPPTSAATESTGAQVAGPVVTLSQLLDDLSVQAVAHLTAPIRFESGEHGAVLNWYGPPNKALVVCGADGVARNRGDYVSGRHMTVILSKPEWVDSWKSEIARLTGISCFTVDGDSERKKQWDELLRLVAQGSAPHFVVVGGCTVDEELPYLAAACVGGTLGTTKIPPRSVGILVIDGLRKSGLAELSEFVYLGRGRVWVLGEGDLARNAGEILEATSLVNAALRDNAIQAKDEFLKRGYSQDDELALIWRNARAMKDFLSRFGHHLLSVDFRNPSIATTYSTTAPIFLPQSQGWDELSGVLWNKLAMEPSQTVLAILAGASLGWVSPALLLAYAPARQYILTQLRRKLDEDFLESVEGELEAYGRALCEESHADCTSLYHRNVSSYTQELVESLLDGWGSPLVETLCREILLELRRAPLGRPVRMAVAGLTLPVAEKLKSALSNTSNLSIYPLLPGDEEALDSYLSNKEQHTLALVLTNHLAGVKIPADRSWYLPTWQPVQIGEVLRLTAKQKHLASLVLPGGFYRYVWLNWGSFYKRRAFEKLPSEVDNVLDYATGALTRKVASWPELLQQMGELQVLSTNPTEEL